MSPVFELSLATVVASLFIATSAVHGMPISPEPEQARCGLELMLGGPDSREVLSAVIDSMDAHIAIVDATGRIVMVNAAWRSYGSENGLLIANSAVGKNYRDCCSQSAGTVDTGGAATAAWIQRALAGGQERFDLVYPCHVASRRSWFEVHGSSFDWQGKRHLVLAHHDVTKRMLLAEQVAALAQAQSVGKVLNELAHELNNALTVVSGFTALAQMGAKDAAEEQQFGLIAQQTERAIALVRRMSQIAPKAEVGSTSVIIAVKLSLMHVLDTIGTLPPNISVVRDVAEVGDISLSLVDLNLVTNELMKNASAAIGLSSGTITIAASREIESKEKVSLALPPLEHGYVRIAFRDSGPGIPPSRVSRLFEPFFRRDVNEAQLGLGLAVVHSVVTAAGGRVAFESLPGEGTSVALYFPAKTPLLVPLPAPKPEATRTAPSRILVVDDDPAVLMVTTAGLRTLGYQVVQAASVSEAKNTLTADIDVVVSDFRMDEGGGFAVADFVRERFPSVPVIIYSGEGDFLQKPESVAAVIGKPFRLPELKALIDRSLAKSTQVPAVPPEGS